MVTDRMFPTPEETDSQVEQAGAGTINDMEQGSYRRVGIDLLCSSLFCGFPICGHI